MFRISIIELGITCGLIALVILIPLIITRGYAKLNERLKKMEDKFSKK
jgi:DMSO/TMAO reductase YedYZ heme-binding membrane subunit